MSCIFSYCGLIYCRKIHEKGLKHAKDSSLSNNWTSRFLQGLSINQCWCASSHPDWRSYEGSGNHNTSYFLLSISALHTNLCWSTERSFMDLFCCTINVTLKRKFVLCAYRRKTNYMPLNGLLHLQYAQHVSGTSMPIIRSSRLYVCYYRL